MYAFPLSPTISIFRPSGLTEAKYSADEGEGEKHKVNFKFYICNQIEPNNNLLWLIAHAILIVAILTMSGTVITVTVWSLLHTITRIWSLYLEKLTELLMPGPAVKSRDQSLVKDLNMTIPRCPAKAM